MHYKFLLTIEKTTEFEIETLKILIDSVAQYCVLIFAFMVPAIFISIHDRSHLYYIINNDILNDNEKESLINEVQAESLNQEISFLDWISKTKPTPNKLKTNDQILNVDNFNLYDLKAKKHDDKIKITKKDYMTETLAKVYINQGKFEDALKAYKILCLKYPEKISLFADQIKIIKKQIKNR